MNRCAMIWADDENRLICPFLFHGKLHSCEIKKFRPGSHCGGESCKAGFFFIREEMRGTRRKGPRTGGPDFQTRQEEPYERKAGICGEEAGVRREGEGASGGN